LFELGHGAIEGSGDRGDEGPAAGSDDVAVRAVDAADDLVGAEEPEVAREPGNGLATGSRVVDFRAVDKGEDVAVAEAVGIELRAQACRTQMPSGRCL
jgi:hypothetical protein